MKKFRGVKSRSNYKLQTYIDIRKHFGENITKPKTFRTPIDDQLVDLYGIISRDLMQTEITARRHGADQNYAKRLSTMFWCLPTYSGTPLEVDEPLFPLHHLLSSIWVNQKIIFHNRLNNITNNPDNIFIGFMLFAHNCHPKN